MRISGWKALLMGVGLGLAGAAIAACDQTEPIDQNFDSSLGADYRAPDALPDGGPTDAASVAAATTEP